MSNYLNRDDTAVSHAKIVREVIPYLSQNHIPMTPDNYRIWYDYFKGEKAEVVERLEELVNRKAEFTPMMLDSIYKEFYQRDGIEESHNKLLAEISAAENASKKASELLGNALKEIINSCKATSGYGGKLKSYLNDVEHAKKIEDLQSIISSLVQDTASAEVSNNKIQEKLKESSSHLAELSAELEEAREEAHRDNLTKLYNRRHFDETLASELEKVKNGVDSSLIMFDIDFFKKFNDNYGHLVGDKLLSTFGRDLDGITPDEAINCRYGGEEFVVILQFGNLSQGIKIAEQVRKTVEEWEFTVKGEPAPVTISGGVTQLKPGDVASTAIERVDKALYHAKRDGRNRINSD